MAGGIDWFRWHHGSVTDMKFPLVAKKSGASVAEVIAFWATILEAASMAEERGVPGDPDFEAIDCALGLEIGKAQRIHKAMQERDLIDDNGHVVSWEKRQVKREREGDPTSAERKRAQRAREKDSDGHADDGHVTPSHAKSHQKKPREEKSILKTPHTPQGGQSAGVTKTVRAAIELKTYIAECKVAGLKPIPDDDKVFDYIADIKLPDDFLLIQWREFIARYSEPHSKRYKDWPTVFRKSVRANWFKLWYIDEKGDCYLTTAGKQAQASQRALKGGA